LDRVESKGGVLLGKPHLSTWWDVFGDPVMDDLIKRCYASNLTLRAAGFQILAAEKQRFIACSELLPQSQTMNAAYTHSQISRNGGAAAAAGVVFGTSVAPPGTVSPVTVPNTPIAGQPPDPTGTTTTATNSGGAAAAGGAGAAAGPRRFFDNWATSLNFSWELDFWGLFRRNLEAASAVLDQSVFNSDEMTVLLLADVAKQYVSIRTLQRRLELARENVALQEQLVAVVQSRYKVSERGSFPAYHQLLSNLENTRALIPSLEITLRETNNQLCSLLGIPMQDLVPCLGDGKVPDPQGRWKLTDASVAALRAAGVPETVLTKLKPLLNNEYDNREELAKALADPEVLKKDERERYLDLVLHHADPQVRIPRPTDYSVVVDIPGAVLLQRPDIKAVEQQLRIANADIGIAEAEMLPHIGLNGSIGLAADQFSRLFSPGSMTGTIGPSLTWNILNYGRLLANVRLQNDVYQQHVAEYQQAILNANQDAEDALYAYLQTMAQWRYLQASADSAVLTTNQYLKVYAAGALPAGTTDLGTFANTLFTTINFRVTQQDLAAQAEGNISLNLILLYRALGGGWQLRLTHGRQPCGPVPPEICHRPILGLEAATPEPAQPGSRPATPWEGGPELLPPPRPAPGAGGDKPGPMPPKGAWLDLDDTALPVPTSGATGPRRKGVTLELDDR
jgi:outer membrane protein TolC